jgi:hypothetical protein
MSDTKTEIDLYDIAYPDDYIPVRGDTIRYYDLNWRSGVVLNSQDGEVTFLTPDNRSRTFQMDSVKVALDTRMRMLATLNEDDAAKNREDFLADFMDRAKKRAENEAISKGAVVDEDGTILTTKKRGKQMDVSRAKEVKNLVKGVIDLIQKSDSPIYKNDITSNFDMDSNTYNIVMKKVLADHNVTKSGQKRGTNYRIVGRTYDS